MANLLIQHGADVNLQSATGLSPLHVAANEGNLKFGEVLIKNGAVIDAVDEKAVTPLQLAAFHGNAQSLKSNKYYFEVFIPHEMQVTNDLSKC